MTRSPHTPVPPVAILVISFVRASGWFWYFNATLTYDGPTDALSTPWQARQSLFRMRASPSGTEADCAPPFVPTAVGAAPAGPYANDTATFDGSILPSVPSSASVTRTV